MKTITITRAMLQQKLNAAKHEAVNARGKSERAFYVAEVARISAMLAS